MSTNLFEKGRIPLFYTFFENVKSFKKVEDFYDFCINCCKKQNLILDVGADLCEGLTKNSLRNKWKGQIFSFDLWKFYDPPIYEEVNYIKGDAVIELRNFFQNNTEKIDLIQFDIRGIRCEYDHPEDQGLDHENTKTEEMMEICYESFCNGTIIIITEFHRLHSDNHFGKDAYHLSNLFANHEVTYNCIAYCETYPLSAWIVDKNMPLRKDDLKKLLNVLSIDKK